ncbi:hypothetical protein Tco_1145124 [Tanacetum coccineum]
MCLHSTIYLEQRVLVQEGTALVSAACFNSAGLLCILLLAYYFLLLFKNSLAIKEDLSRNFELPETTPSLGGRKNCWVQITNDKVSVSAVRHIHHSILLIMFSVWSVLVPADSDIICYSY